MHLKNKHLGFTLIELLVVMAIISVLLTLATPRYFANIEKAKEVTLRENLATMRDAIDKYYADTGKYPTVLTDLVARHYLRNVPLDPLTESRQSWIIVAPSDPEKGAIFDIHSGAQGAAHDGSRLSEW